MVEGEHHGSGLLCCLRAWTAAIIDGKINSQVYQYILQENLRQSVCQLKLNRSWVMQQENNPKHRSKSTIEWLQQKKIHLLVAQSES
jgi:hypothetical protein